MPGDPVPYYAAYNIGEGALASTISLLGRTAKQDIAYSSITLLSSCQSAINQFF